MDVKAADGGHQGKESREGASPSDRRPAAPCRKRGGRAGSRETAFPWDARQASEQSTSREIRGGNYLKEEYFNPKECQIKQSGEWEEKEVVNVQESSKNGLGCIQIS